MATRALDAGGEKAGAQVRAEIVFLLLDGLRRSRPSGPPEVVLCALGLTREGTPHPLALRVIPQEDERSWRALLHDLKADGIGSELLLITSDGHPALVKAIHAVYPDIPLQMSVAHRLLALARKVDARWRAACLAEARQIFAAPDRAAAVTLFRDWHARWLKQGEPAVRSLEADLAACLAFYRFPSPLWNKIRTVNLVERIFRDARRAALPTVPGVPGWQEGIQEGINQAESAPDDQPGPAAKSPTFFRLDRPPLPAAEPHEWALGGSGAEGVSLPEPSTSGTPPPRPGADLAPSKAIAADAVIQLPETPAEVQIPEEAPAAPARPAEGIVLHLAPIREAEPIVFPVPTERAAPFGEPGHPEWPQPEPRWVELSADEAFEEWLRASRRQTIRVGLVMAFISAAGLLAGLVLSLDR